MYWSRAYFSNILTRLLDLKLGSGLLSRLLGIVIIRVNIIYNNRFVFIKGVYKGGFLGFLRL